MIRGRGYEGGIAILRRHVAEVRPVPRGEVYLWTERLIGEQAQVDWAHVGSLAVQGVERREKPREARRDGSTQWA